MAVVRRGGDKRWIRFTLDREYSREFGFLAAFFQLWDATIFWTSGYVTDYIIYVLGSDSNPNTSSFTALPSTFCPGLAEETRVLDTKSRRRLRFHHQFIRLPHRPSSLTWRAQGVQHLICPSPRLLQKKLRLRRRYIPNQTWT